MSIGHIARKLLSTESEWNPKVMLSRVVLRVLPESAIHRMKKSYYAYLATHTTEDWITERDVFVARNLISPGDTVLDIGANLGLVSRFLSACVGPEGKVYSFEPIPQIFEFLTNNIRKMGLNNVEAVDFAASDAERNDTMVIPRWSWGSECWYDAQMRTETTDPSLRTIQVKSRTLDSFFAGTPQRISFIKCDANYHELAVLKGGLQTIRRCMPAMLIEVKPDPDDRTSTAAATFELLRNEGFGVYWFDDGSVVPRQPGQRSQNYLFLTAKHLKALDAAGPFSPKGSEK